MKYVKAMLALVVLFVLAGVGYALPTAHTNAVSLVLSNVCDGEYNDFNWQFSGYDDQWFRFSYDKDLTGVACSFRIVRPIKGTIYKDVPTTSVTVSGTNVTFSIARTNIPPAASYYGELLSWESTATNFYRSIAQGKIMVTWSLYNNDTNYFTIATTNAAIGQVYIHPSWQDPPWLSTTSGLGSTYATVLQHTGLTNWSDVIWQRLTNIVANTNNYQFAYTSVTNINALSNNWSTAYSWGNHASAGYLTGNTNRYDGPLTVGHLGMLNTNIATNASGLTQAAYTGSVTTVAYTGEIPIVRGRTYAYGFTKSTSYGTGVLTIAGNTLTATNSGACSNWCSALTTNGRIIIRLDGDGVSLCNVSGIYVKEMTNGQMNVADNLYLGDSLFIGAGSNINLGDGGTVATMANLTAASNALDARATWSSNAAVWSSNSVNGLSNYAGQIYAIANWSSNAAVWDSNAVWSVSNGYVIADGVVTAIMHGAQIALSNSATTALNTNNSQNTRLDTLGGAIVGASNDFIAADAGISNAYAAADTAVSNGVKAKYEAADAGISNALALKLALVGGVMTGPVTNELGIYGNGLGLTNIPAAGIITSATRMFLTAAEVATATNTSADAIVTNANRVFLTAAGSATATNAVRVDGTVPLAAAYVTTNSDRVFLTGAEVASVTNKQAATIVTNSDRVFLTGAEAAIATNTSANAIVTNANRVFLTAAESAIATNVSDASGWSAYPATQTINFGDNVVSGVEEIVGTAIPLHDLEVGSTNSVSVTANGNVNFTAVTSVNFNVGSLTAPTVVANYYSTYIKENVVVSNIGFVANGPATTAALTVTNGLTLATGNMNAGGRAITNADYVQTTGTTTKAITVSCPNGTTNAGNLAVTGVGFIPKGATVLAAGVEIPGIEGSPFSSAVVDSAGNDYGICTYCAAASQGMYSFNGSAKIYWLSGVDSYNLLDWVSWDADGATFSRTVSGTPTTNTIVYQFLFYR